jgi:hypothetical protein
MIRVVATAQETFKRMMKEEVAPSLRRLGLRGSGQTFALPSETHWALIGFQRSFLSSADELSFTINLTVVSKRAWEKAREGDSSIGGERPAPNGTHRPPVWWYRIGSLLPGGGDHWWSLTGGAATESLASEVVAAIRDHALPEMILQIAEAPRARPPYRGFTHPS